MKLLVVEDEPKTGEYLQQGLTEAGFVVDLARNDWTICQPSTSGSII